MTIATISHASQKLALNCLLFSIFLGERWPAPDDLYHDFFDIPGFIAEDLPSRSLKEWYPFNLTGKALTSIYVLKNIKMATWCCLLRLVFYPLFAACLNGPKWLKTEVPVAILTFMLGVTNGYLTSVLMILTPKSVSVSEAEFSAIAMVVFLGIGLVGGSVIGWFWII
ncbi:EQUILIBRATIVE NUCLEOSIDE TRANSPORTER [Salix viminalis]|uniref:EQUILIBRATIVE NUCLEOSIDE TRANSPORTER n=1 Tax=Salix viminalis TaxID=40686 RepID=A0A9Q0NNV4_SALVM|nr:EQUILIBRATIVE NUCLEOSIDE TRANSPORTER [Salix viminalis]